MTAPGGQQTGRLVAVEIDTLTVPPSRDYFQHERAIAIRDLISDNRFQPAGRTEGGFRLRLAMHDGKLLLDISDSDRAPVARHLLSLTPLRRVVRDYFLICDSYYEALRRATPAQIEAIDVGRRGLHNEGAEILQERLDGKVATDLSTSRRLFTLVCALDLRG